MYIFLFFQKRKVIFKEEWENEFLFSVNILNKPVCLVCYRELNNLGLFRLKRHYESCHTDMHSITGTERAELIKKLKNDFQIYNSRTLHIANSKMNDAELTTTRQKLKASYVIALALANKDRPFEDGDYFKEMCLSVLPVLGEPGEKVQGIMREIPLSPRTIERRNEDIEDFLKSETKQRLRNAKYMSLCIGECIDQDGSRYLIICVKTVDNSFKPFEEFLKLESFSSDVCGKVIYESFQRNVVPLIDVNKLSAIWVDGGVHLVDENEGFVSHFIKSGFNIPIFQGMLPQQSLFSTNTGLTESIQIVGRVIKRLGKTTIQRTRNKELNIFLKELNTECGDSTSLVDFKCLSGRILQQLLALREEIIEILADQQCPDDAELLKSFNDIKFVLDLAFLCDMTEHFKNLNTVLRGKDKNMYDFLHAFKKFARRLHLLASEIESQNVENFPQIRVVINKYSNTQRLSVFSKELYRLLDCFRSRIRSFAKVENILNIYNNPLTCSTENFPTVIQFELSVMRKDQEIPLGKGIGFWEHICPVKYSETRKLIYQLYSMFSTTHTCESAITLLVQIKSKLRRKMTNLETHLETLLRMKCYNKDIDVEKVMDFHKLKNESEDSNCTSNVVIKSEPL